MGVRFRVRWALPVPWAFDLGRVFDQSMLVAAQADILLSLESSDWSLGWEFLVRILVFQWFLCVGCIVVVLLIVFRKEGDLSFLVDASAECPFCPMVLVGMSLSCFRAKTTEERGRE